jgi:release factor glutamine methyltransferase
VSANGSDHIRAEATLVEAWGQARRRLEAVGVDTPVLDARILLEASAGVRRLDIVTDPHRPLSAEQAAAFEAAVARREAREPVSHILGRKGFWTIELAVTPAVLTPRPETELMVEAVLGATQPASAFIILDLGVGSGAILLAVLADRPLAQGVGVDVSRDALAVAEANARALGLSDRVRLQAGDWGEGLTGPFDVIVSNPPYIPAGDIASLSPEVARYDPRLALDGGADGLDAYRAIARQASGLLAADGFLVLEVGAGQAADVTELMRQGGLVVARTLKDLAGHDRTLVLRKAVG